VYKAAEVSAVHRSLRSALPAATVAANPVGQIFEISAFDVVLLASGLFRTRFTLHSRFYTSRRFRMTDRYRESWPVSAAADRAAAATKRPRAVNEAMKK